MDTNDTAEIIIGYLQEYNVTIKDIKELAFSTAITLKSGILINAYKSGKIIVQVKFGENTRQDASALLHGVLPVDAIWQISAYGDMVAMEPNGLPKIMFDHHANA